MRIQDVCCDVPPGTVTLPSSQCSHCRSSIREDTSSSQVGPRTAEGVHTCGGQESWDFYGACPAPSRYAPDTALSLGHGSSQLTFVTQDC